MDRNWCCKQCSGLSRQTGGTPRHSVTFFGQPDGLRLAEIPNFGELQSALQFAAHHQSVVSCGRFRPRRCFRHGVTTHAPANPPERRLHQEQMMSHLCDPCGGLDSRDQDDCQDLEYGQVPTWSAVAVGPILTPTGFQSPRASHTCPSSRPRVFANPRHVSTCCTTYRHEHCVAKAIPQAK